MGSPKCDACQKLTQLTAMVHCDQVIQSSLLDARVAASDLGGLQLHGTGTALGDPIEMGAAVAVISQNATSHSEGGH